MTQTTNNYERLYDNMKLRFTVPENNCEYTLGEYMLMKASVKSEETSTLPVAVSETVKPIVTSVTSLATYVNNKLTIKSMPAKDKTIHTFPLRTSASAFLSASVACAFILSFALIGAKAMSTGENTQATAVAEAETAVSETIE